MTQRTILITAAIIDCALWFTLGFLLFFSPSSFGVDTMSNNRNDNSEVIQAWLAGQEANSHTKNLRTDGTKLFSYRLCIGDTFAGEKIAVNYTASVGEFRSQTTSQHVGLAKRSADQTMHPEVYAMTDSLRPF
tara:strand:- start:811 stop:1209 length:399 start_codon:yes stop_codon:yes gene_type:complete